ncbi:DnaD domain-containing protein [Radiobacillus sp. PE A8.2]|uniref:DnaD domain-containing protein n=1 Tax=Radiobacillus sp. PE A8.2 TaxID=3380349 RepID=UPI00388F004C
MNYIKEINAFYNIIETNPLSASACTLWHTLMHISNRTGWKPTFTVAAAVLKLKSGLKDSSFKRAREELQHKGFISFQSQGGNQAAVYQIISLSSNMDHSTDYCSDQTMDQSTDHSVDRSADPLYKQNNTKQKEKNNTTDAHDFYADNFGDICPFIVNEIATWTNDVGDALVVEAIKRAVSRNILSWSYVEKILLSWKDKGIRSVEAARAEGIAFITQRKKKLPRSSRGGRREVVPEWFEDRDLKNDVRRNPVSDEVNAEVMEIARRYQK